MCDTCEASPGGASGKEPARLPMLETEEIQFWSLGWEGPLVVGLVTHSSILAWRIPWTEDPGSVVGCVF